MTEDMLKQFRIASALICIFVSIIPVYFLFNDSILTGSHVGVSAPQRIYHKDEDPVFYYGIIVFSALFAAAFWAGRTYLVKQLGKQITDNSQD